MTTASYFFNAVSYTKDIEQFTQGDIDKNYKPYTINRVIACYKDLVVYADCMNLSHNIPKEYQLYFYNLVIPKSKRRTVYANKTKDNDLEVVMEYYNLTQEKADPYMKILSNEQIDILRERINTGGRTTSEIG